MSFQKYLDVVSGSFKKAVKIEWLNPDESVAFEFTNALYDINVDLSVNYQNGSRRTCTLILNNDRNQFPINFNNIWFGQKFKLWMGIYIDNETPYYFPQGVFYISNPNEVYQPSNRTIKINGIDKWAYLDGTLHGKLSGTYQTGIGSNLVDATKELLLTDTANEIVWLTNKTIGKYFKDNSTDTYKFEYKSDKLAFVQNNTGKHSTTATTKIEAMRDMSITLVYSYDSEPNFDKFTFKINDKFVENESSGVKTVTSQYRLSKGDILTFVYKKDGSDKYGGSDIAFFKIAVDHYLDVIDPVPPFISPNLLSKTKYVLTTDTSKVSGKTYYEYDESSGTYKEYTGTTIKGKYTKELVVKCPYTAKVERGKTYADVLLEYATILCAHIYYDANGRLTLEPMTDEADDITDTDKEVVWHFTVEEKQLLGLNMSYNFDKVFNDIIVLGNVTNGYQFKARVQNRNPMSDTCIQKIGRKTKEPIEDNQYYSDDQCRELAIYYAKTDTILQKSGDISSTPLYHLDVNKIASVSTPNNNMSKELFLITGYSLSSSNAMSIKVTSINNLKDFSVVEESVYE